MVNECSYEVDDTKFEILGLGYLSNWVGVPLLDFFILTDLRGRGEITLNSWSDEVKNAKFGILGLKYP